MANMRFITGLIATIALIATTTPANAETDQRDGTVLVFGDSMTSSYNNTPGDPMQGWWSKLAEERNLNPVPSSQSGRGLIKRGNLCAGTAVRERSGAVINLVKPDEIWVAVGRNDYTVCINGKTVLMSSTFRVKAANAAFARLATQATAAGVDLRNVYVTVAWGTAKAEYRTPVASSFANAARAAGLTFIDVPRMDLSMTVDGTHPNAKGNAYIAGAFGSKMRPHVQ